MSATLLIVELLIIGFQVLALVALLVGLIFHSSVGPYTSPDGLKKWLTDWTPVLKDWIPLLTVGAFVTAYTLGLVWDRLIGFAGSLGTRHSPNIGGRMAKATRDHPDLASRAESFQRHIRLLRATMIDSAFGALLLLVGMLFDRSALRCWLMISLGFLVVFSCLAWRYTKQEFSKGSQNACEAAEA